MKVGDLIHAIDLDDTCYSGRWCGCWFCSQNSNRVGLIVKNLSGVREHKFAGYWSVLFDVGLWRCYGSEMEVISESR